METHWGRSVVESQAQPLMRPGSRLVTRGELRSAANRCSDGIGDFDWVLSRSKQADRQALFGRAVCRKKLGDTVGAMADAERYRHDFPSGPRLSDLKGQVGSAR